MSLCWTAMSLQKKLNLKGFSLGNSLVWLTVLVQMFKLSVLTRALSKSSGIMQRNVQNLMSVMSSLTIIGEFSSRYCFSTSSIFLNEMIVIMSTRLERMIKQIPTVQTADLILLLPSCFRIEDFILLSHYRSWAMGHR